MRRALLLPLFLVACGDNQTHPDAHGLYDAGTAAPLQCVPNLDGKIESKELQPILGVTVKYLVSPANTTRAVDVAGTVDASGHRVWDMGVDVASDQVVAITASSLDGKWYAASFPAGQFTTPFDAAQTLDAVYTQDDTGLFLLGLASTQPSPPEGKTLLVYAQPVMALKLPLTAGATWTSVGVAQNATFRGLPYDSQDTYTFTDDATGELIVPSLTFTQAHRVRSTVTIAPSAGANVTTKQASFFFECFGEVARATSQPNETQDDFTTAAEVRRFGP
jgi:hypothetical protein